MNHTNCVEFDCTQKVFGTLHALKDFSLPIKSGCIYGFLGPNGAGKTTAMRILVGISKPTGGNIHVFGTSDIPSVRHLIGYLPEEKGLYKRMRVLDYIVYLGRLNGMRKLNAIKRAKELLEEFELTAWERSRCQVLSKGLGQKVQIVGTLVHDPQLMVLDEPFSGLDPINVEVVRKLIHDRSKANATIILSTHIMEQAEVLCDEIVLINKGEAVLKGPIDEVRKGNVITIEHSGTEEVFAGLTQLVSYKQISRLATLEVTEGCDLQELLKELLNRTKVTQFNTSATSLHEVFLREVGKIETANEEEKTITNTTSQE